MKIINLSVLLLLSATLSGCAMERHRPDTETPTAPVVMAPPPAAPTPTVAHTPAPTHAVHPGVPAEKSLGWLKNGNSRFLTNKVRKDGQTPADIAKLSKGQHPHAIVLSCSDSRVPPEIVFDQKLGEIFVIRTAGEDPDASAIASIEYAVEHLGPQLLVVMGHSSCGAVKAAIEVGDKDAGSPALNSLVHNIQPRLGAYQSRMPSSEYKEESWAEANGVAKELIQKSEILKKHVENGSLKIVTALYQTGNGKVDFSQ